MAVCKVVTQVGCKTDVSVYDAAHNCRAQHGRGAGHLNCSRAARAVKAACEEWAVQFFKGNSMGLSEHEDQDRRRPANSEQQEQEEERRKLRRLQVMMNMVMSVISQDQGLTVEEAAELVANTKRAALAMFPDKEFAYDILYKPRLQRLMAERFRLQ